MTDNQMIKRKAIGRTCYLGYLYDARREEVINLSLFDDKLPTDLIESYENPNTRYDFTLVDSYEEKFKKLSVDAEMRLNILCGQFKFEGSGKYLNEEKKSHKSVKATMIYEIQTRKENVTISNKSFDDKYISFKILEGIQNSAVAATHIIVGIQWGANAVCTFEYENKENVDKSQVEGKFMASFEQLKFLIGGGKNLGGEANVEFDSKYLDLKNKTSISLIADIVSKDELPIEYDRVIQFIKKLPQFISNTNSGKGVPIEIELLPLNFVCKMFSTEIKIEKQIKNLNIEVISRFEKEFDRILKSKQTLYDLDKEMNENINYFLQDSQNEISELKRIVNLSETKLKDRVSNLLYKIRCGDEQESSLIAVLNEYHQNEDVLIQQKLNDKLIVDVKNKIQFINSLKLNQIEYIDKLKDLNLLIQAQKDSDLYVFKFDKESKSNDSKLFDKNWNYFLTLNRTKPNAKFFVFDYELHSNDNNKRSKSEILISHYRNGHLIEYDLINYLKDVLDFPIAKPLNQNNLLSGIPLPKKEESSKNPLHELNLPCPNWKVEYGCPIDNLKWKCEKCKEYFAYDSDLIFACKCSKVSCEHFGFKCSNSHHPKYPEEEFIKYDTSELKAYLLANIISKIETKMDAKNIEQIIWFDLNVNSDENKLHQTKLKTEFVSLKFNVFRDLKDLEKYIKELDKKRTILIVSGSAYLDVFEKFYDLEMITDILIFTSRQRAIDAIKYQKVKKIVFSIKDLIDCIRSILNNSTPIDWLWQSDANNFEKYDKDLSNTIENSYQAFLAGRGTEKTIEIQIKRVDNSEIEKYLIDFENMCQINEKSKYKRKIKRFLGL